MFYVGQQAQLCRIVSEDDIIKFANLSGDMNYVHMNTLEAEKLGFRGKICHGLLIGAFISTIIGTSLPGPGSVYLSQTFSFKKPAYVGDTVTVKVEIISIDAVKRIVTLKTWAVNQNGEYLVDGEAIIKVPELKDKRY